MKKKQKRTETATLIDELHGSLVRIDHGLQRSLGRVSRDISRLIKAVDSEEDAGTLLEKQITSLTEKCNYLERLVWACFTIILGGSATILWNYFKIRG